jgi:hypothetical protein
MRIGQRSNGGRRLKPPFAPPSAFPLSTGWAAVPHAAAQQALTEKHDITAFCPAKLMYVSLPAAPAEGGGHDRPAR